ncbi:MAG: lipopolysaccharide heptosyltransferase II [Candidatus Omnitrophica bacterium 4484_171]|nr:MAG: lipopolysaccharide heptosyltransferase II [Candidatus Omnitrophica bacterium 4484_171]
MRKPVRILIVRTDRMGDVVLSTPVIRNIREAYPDSHIAFMCRPYTREILEGNPYLDEVIVYDKYGKHRSFLSSLCFSFLLRKKRFDLALILHPTNRAHMITFFAGIRVRAGWNRKMGFLLTRKLPHTKQLGQKHEMEYTLDLLKLIDVPVKYKDMFFPLKDESISYVKSVFSEYGVSDSDKIVVIHPSASCASKRWPQDYFIKLIKFIKDNFKSKIIIISAKDQAQYADKIINESAGLIDMRGKLILSRLGALLREADIFISNDSGPVHIAAALGTPVISIFGRNDRGLSPKRWRPLGDKAFFMHKDVGCNPCLAHNCTKGFLCLKAVKPDEVFSLVKKIIF